MTSPTQRTLALLRADGYTAAQPSKDHPESKHMRECQCCRSTFEGDVRSKWCSRRCKSKAAYPSTRRYPKTCAICGTQFMAFRSTIETCSRKCGAAYRGGPHKTTPRSANKTCANCGAPIWKKRSFNWARAYCDFRCKTEHARVLFAGEANPNYKAAGLRTCIACGKTYKSYQSGRRYCGAMCSRAFSAGESMANLRRGAEAERECVLELKRRGYNAFRSAASKGPFDVIGISESEVLLIQVKRTKAQGRRNQSKACADLRTVPVPQHAIIRRQMWCWVDRKGWFVVDVQ